MNRILPVSWLLRVKHQQPVPNFPEVGVQPSHARRFVKETLVRQSVEPVFAHRGHEVVAERGPICPGTQPRHNGGGQPLYDLIQLRPGAFTLGAVLPICPENGFRADNVQVA